MSSSVDSRAPGIPQPTLADVLTALAKGDLPQRRREELASAVRSAARALGRRPENVPADPRLLAGRLKEIAPKALDLSDGRWSNIRSLLRAALESVTTVAPGRHLTPLTPAWQAHWGTLPTRSLKTKLSRLLHYCSAAGVTPNDIGEATFAAFREHLDLTLLKQPPVVYRETLLGWNAARAQVPGWPDFVATIPTRRQTWTMPWDAFPTVLIQDVRAWLDRLAGHDLLDESSLRPVRPRTLENREYQLRQFASALVHRGRDPATLTSLADLIAIDSLKDGLRYFLQRRGNEPSSAITDLATSLKAVARHHVRTDEDHLAKMAAVISRLRRPQPGLTKKNRSRLRPLDDSGNALALVRLPETLMCLAERERRPRRAALLAQMAVIIEILLMAPIRIGNLAVLDVERHLVRPGRADGGLHIVLDRDEVKNDEAQELPLPPESVHLIENYLENYRPRLAASGNTALFPTHRGTKSVETLREQIIAVVHRHTGLTVHPHLFRHIAAKFHLGAHPGEYECVRRVLGHRSIETTTAFYTGLEAAAAVRHFDAAILKLRRTGSVG